MDELRAATIADVPALEALIQRAYRGDAARVGWTHEADLLDGQRTDAASLTDVVRDPAQCLLVMLEADQLIGCVQVSHVASRLAYLGLLAVEPALQAGGFGKRLIEAAEANARDVLNVTQLEMTVIARRAELIAYYERRGYALTGVRRPFPRHEPRNGLPKVDDLDFAVLAKAL